MTNLTDQALWTLRRIVCARRFAPKALEQRLSDLNYRAFKRWQRRNAKAPGTLAPQVAGYRSLPEDERRAIRARMQERIGA